MFQEGRELGRKEEGLGSWRRGKQETIRKEGGKEGGEEGEGARVALKSTIHPTQHPINCLAATQSSGRVPATL